MQCQSAKMTGDWTTIASLVGTILLVRGTIPPEIEEATKKTLTKTLSSFKPEMGSFVIGEYEDSFYNELFEYVKLYLGFISSKSATKARLTKLKNSKGIVKSLVPNVVAEDTFKGVKISWVLNCTKLAKGEMAYSFTSTFAK